MKLTSVVEAIVSVKNLEKWGHLDGPIYGRGGKLPVKIKMRPHNNDEWAAARAAGHNKWKKKLKTDAEKSAAEEASKDFSTYPADRTAAVARSVFRNANAYLWVGWSGPSFANLDEVKKWIGWSDEGVVIAPEPVKFQDESYPAPPGVSLDSFVLTGGRYQLPDEFEPPESWKFDTATTLKLIDLDPSFVAGFLGIRSLLSGEVDTDDDAEDDTKT